MLIFYLQATEQNPVAQNYVAKYRNIEPVGCIEWWCGSDAMLDHHFARAEQKVTNHGQPAG